MEVDDMTIEEVIRLLEMQEEILQFSHFTNADAWELGRVLVDECKRREASAIVSIRLNNGFILFQHALNGTSEYNQQWVQWKHNTVCATNHSSLLLCMQLKQNEETLEDIHLDPKEYTLSGGGFPILIEEVGVIGSIVLSGLDSVSDHDVIIKAISKYLHVDEVPRIPVL
jgi:uncharacterized protein (UPF0303 family)